MTKPPNRYTKLPGYNISPMNIQTARFVSSTGADLVTNGILKSRNINGLSKKMPDGPSRTEITLDSAKQLAIVSSRSVHSHDYWWLADT
jgi:hypothetical protein